MLDAGYSMLDAGWKKVSGIGEEVEGKKSKKIRALTLEKKVRGWRPKMKCWWS